MSFFKEDPVRKLRTLLNALKATELTLWHEQNQADFARLIKFLRQEIPAIEGMTIAEAQKHSEVQKNPIFSNILKLFAETNRVMQYIDDLQKKQAVIDDRDIQRQLNTLEDDLIAILHNVLVLKKERLQAQEIIGAEAIETMLLGHDIRLVINATRAVFSSNPSMTHEDINNQYFLGTMAVNCSIPAQSRLINVSASKYTPEEVLGFFAQLQESEQMKPLHGRIINYQGKCIGRFLCRYGRERPTKLREIPAQLEGEALRDTLTRLIKKAEAAGDWAKAEMYRRMQRERQEGD